MSIKIPKISYFSFSVKLSEKKKVPIARKKKGGDGGEGGLTRKGWRKNRGRVVTLKDTMMIIAVHYQLADYS